MAPPQGSLDQSEEGSEPRVHRLALERQYAKDALVHAVERLTAIDARCLRTAQEDWETFWSALHPVELTAAVERNAGSLTDTHALGGADAVHLASALALGLTDLVVAVWDRRFRQAAMSTGLRVAPA